MQEAVSRLVRLPSGPILFPTFTSGWTLPTGIVWTGEATALSTLGQTTPAPPAGQQGIAVATKGQADVMDAGCEEALFVCLFVGLV